MAISFPKTMPNVAQHGNGLVLIDTKSKPMNETLKGASSRSFADLVRVLRLRGVDWAGDAGTTATHRNSYKRLGEHTPPVFVIRDLSIEDFLKATGKLNSAEDHSDLVALERDNEERFFDWRNSMLSQSLDTATAMKLLHIMTRSGIKRRIDRKELLAVRAGAVYRFPRWQFDPRSDNGVVPGLSRVLKATRVDALTTAAWLCQPHPGFSGKKPIDVLKAGRVEAVVDEVSGIGAT